MRSDVGCEPSRRCRRERLSQEGAWAEGKSKQSLNLKQASRIYFSTISIGVCAAERDLRGAADANVQHKSTQEESVRGRSLAHRFCNIVFDCVRALRVCVNGVRDAHVRVRACMHAYMCKSSTCMH